MGGNRTVKVDVRVIATTNRDLEESIEKKEFRQDLYFRLNVVPILVPPLRERKSDIPLLADQFRQRFARKHGIDVTGISPSCMAVLEAHSWPGNVRELQNVIERAVILCSEGSVLEPTHLGLVPQVSSPNGSASSRSSAPAGLDSTGNFYTLSELEKQHILVAMERSHGNRTVAAKMLDISIRTLRNKLHEYHYKGPEKASLSEAEA